MGLVGVPGGPEHGKKDCREQENNRESYQNDRIASRMVEDPPGIDGREKGDESISRAHNPPYGGIAAAAQIGALCEGEAHGNGHHEDPDCGRAAVPINSLCSPMAAGAANARRERIVRIWWACVT